MPDDGKKSDNKRTGFSSQRRRRKVDSKLLRTVANEILSDRQPAGHGARILPDDDDPGLTALDDEMLPPLPDAEDELPPPPPLDEPPPLPGSDDEPPPPPDDITAISGEDDDAPKVQVRTAGVTEAPAAKPDASGKKPLFKKRLPLGEILVRHGVINHAQLEYALQYQQEKARDAKLGEIMIKLELISESNYGQLISGLMSQLQADKINMDELGQFVDFDLAGRFKMSQLEKDLFFPLRIVENRGIRVLDVFIKDDADLFKLDDLAAIFSVSKVRPVGHFDESLLRSLIDEIKKGKAAEIKPDGEKVTSITVLAAPREDEVASDAIQRGREDNYISRITDKVIYEGVRLGASDIHVEFGELPRVRYRVDGLLQEGGWITPEDYPAVISRFKILSELDISERRVPQDGNIRLGIEGYGVLDFRVNTIPVSGNEKVCLRILDSSKLHSLTLDKIGLPDDTLDNLIEKINRPQGMMLITGPTGSGKSTTLYSSLIYLLETRGKEMNICTAEDPIEYKLEGLNQTQLNEKVGLTFPKILKALLRQDPDVILVGEIRDLETGGLAIKASQTGHMVLSTLHTNTAVATIARLVNMGVESYMVADSLLAVINQRLARRICKHCAEPHTSLTRQELALIPPDERDSVQLYKGAGCAKCGHKGYKGRIGFYEYLPVNRALRRLILNGASEEEMLLQAREDGFLTLREFGVNKAKDGQTTLEEVLSHTIDQFE